MVTRALTKLVIDKIGRKTREKRRQNIYYAASTERDNRSWQLNRHVAIG